MPLLRQRLLGFAARRLHADRAEDVVQDTLLVLTEKYPNVDRLEDLLPLSITILRFKIGATFRKAHRRGEDRSVPVQDAGLPSKADSPLDLLARRQLLEKLREALRQLGTRCRELYRLKLEGRTFAEIGQHLKAGSVNTVYSWEFRCRRQLRQILGDGWKAALEP